MVTHGNGGWTHSDLYTMPIMLREFYLKKMNEMAEKHNAAQRETQSAK